MIRDRVCWQSHMIRNRWLYLYVNAMVLDFKYFVVGSDHGYKQHADCGYSRKYVPPFIGGFRGRDDEIIEDERTVKVRDPVVDYNGFRFFYPYP